VDRLFGRTNVELALRESEQRYALLFQSAPGALIAFNVDSLEILAVNEAAVAQYGWSREEFLALSLRELRPDDWAGAFWRANTTLRAGHEIHGVYRHRVRSGRLIDVELRTSTLPIGGGRLRLLLATDVTVRLRSVDATRFLDNATSILTSSLEPSFVCRNLAALAVPRLGEWCIVHRPDARGRLSACGFAHADPFKHRLVAELVTQRSPLPSDHPANVAFHEGRAIELRAPDTARRVLARALGDSAEPGLTLEAATALYVPVIGRGGVLAVLEFVSDQAHAHDPSTTALAMAIAERSAIALDNALLHQETRRALVAATQPGLTTRSSDEIDLASWVFETIPHCFLRVDREWRVTHVNGEAEQVLQHPREELVGGDFWTLFSDARGTEFETGYRRAMRDACDVVVEAYYPPLDGWFEGHAKPSGSGLAIYFRDITRQHRTLQRLEESETHYRDFLESATDLIHMIGTDGRVLFANRAWRETLGYSEEELTRLHVMEVVAPESRAAARETLDQCLLGHVLPEQELVVVSKTGRRFVVRGRANCRFVDGRPVSTRAIYRDVTAEVEARKLLAQAQRTEAASARAKTAFLDRMSHEMRTPLTAVIGFADILAANRAGRLSERDLTFAQRIALQGRNLLAIVEDVLAYAEIESRRVDLAIAPVDLREIVREVVALYELAAAERGIALDVALPEQAAPMETDRATLRRVLRYLLNDATARADAERVVVTLGVEPGTNRPATVTVRTVLAGGTDRHATDADPAAALELGLSIAQSLAQVLGYDLAVARPDGGVVERTLSLQGSPRLGSRTTDESAKTLHAVLDASPLPIIAFDPDWTVRLWNRAAEALFGWTSAEAIERRFALLRPEDDASFRDLLRTALDAPGGVTDAPSVHLHRDGHTIDVRVALAALRAPDGRLRGFLSIITDVTARKRLEEELRQAQKMEVVGRLSGGIAHDFNNLLTVISAHAQFLLMDMDGSEESEERGDVMAIQDATERAAALTRQLLTFSRKEIAQKRLVDVNRKLANTERLLRRILGSHIEFAAVPSPVSPIVFADPAQVEQVLMNLVLNARDAMPRGGALVVETAVCDAGDAIVPAGITSPSGRWVLVTVSDTGVGMDSATRARVFEPFFTTKGEHRGTGLGLSTVQTIVTEDGGHVEVESTLGMGTSFRVWLPFAESAWAEQRAVSDTAAVRGSETVLVVEDQDAVRAVATRVLRAYGYTVLTARHGNDALAIVRQSGAAIKLLLTDLVMPEMPGNELAAHVRKMAPHIAVLFMSGYSETPAGLTQRDVETPLVRKPFGGEDLARAVRGALDGGR
jgi:PAS domain S-box-containing protein